MLIQQVSYRITRGRLQYTTLLFLLCTIGTSFSQNLSGVINTYAKVNSISGTSFTLSNSSIAGAGTITDFDAGSTVLVIQMKGATIETSNDASYGDILNYGNAGNYEFTTVSSRSGTTITLSTLTRSYDAAGLVQVVAYTEYADPVVNGTITAVDWDASAGRGGVIVLSASGNITLSADIDASLQGFAGGSVSNSYNGSCSSSHPYVTNSTNFAVKGEGIVLTPSNNRSRGKIASGGGGAAPKNAGGGGGGNYTSGGNGGYGYGCSTSNNGGGIGGLALSYAPALNKAFLGGGGGGGQANNGQATNGSNGGGIIFIFADTVRTDCATNWGIYSAGGDSGLSNNEGAGGGGAGGAISLTINAFDTETCSINILARGGNGGSVGHTQVHGGGGGGGIGAILINIPLPDSVAVISTPGGPGTDCKNCGSTGTGGGDCATNCYAPSSTVRPFMSCNNDITTEVATGTCTATVSYTLPFSIDSVSSSINDFTYDYDTIYWNEYHYGSGTIDYSSLDTDIAITSANDNTSSAYSDYCIYVAADGTLSYDWYYISSDNRSDPSYDIFGYYLDGVFTQLTASSGTSQSGTAFIAVTEGSSFCFSQQSSDGKRGTATTTINNFSAPGYQVPVVLNSGLASGSAFPVGTTLVQYIASYAYADNDTCSFNVIVTETTAPTAICQDITVNLDETGSASITANDIDNGSSDNCTLSTLTIDKSTFTCSDVGTVVVTLEGTDAAGNTDSCTSDVTVEDNEAPILTTKDITVDLTSSSVSITPTQVYDSAGDNCSTVNLISVTPNTFDSDDIGANPVLLLVRDGFGLPSTALAMVTVNSGLTAKIDASATELNCNTSSITLDASGSTGFGTLAYDWSDAGSSTTPSIVVSTGGTYTVTVTDTDNGVTDVESITITQITDPGSSASGSTLSCYGDTNGTVTLTVTNGKAPFLYDWDNDETGDNDDTQNLNSLTAGAYNVTVTDANNCTTSTSATVTQPAAINANNYAATVCDTSANEVNLTVYEDSITTETGTTTWYYDALKTNPVAAVPPVVAVSDGSSMFYEFQKTATGCTADGKVDFTVRVCAAPLPVELIYFIGEQQDCEVYLQWATETELNASHFEVQRSSDGINFEKIAEQSAFGNTTSIEYYEFMDEEVNMKDNYYRLKQIDLDRRFEYSEIIQIKVPCFDQSIQKVNFYPNPVFHKDEVNIIFDSVVKNANIEVKIYDALGRIVSLQTMSVREGFNALTLSIENVPAGQYFLNIRDVRHKGITKPFVIIRE